MPTDRWRFGDFELDVARASLTQRGVVVALRPKSFALLQYLVTHPARLVPKDELLSAVWPDVVVTEDSLTRCISEIRVVLGDTGAQAIKTVSRRGYLFDAPVVPAVDALAAAATAGDHSAPIQAPTGMSLPLAPTLRTRIHWLVFGGAALSAVIVALVLLVRERPAAPRQTLVVLPFVALGSDAVQAPLADAITEELTGALARVRGLSVISSNTALAFKGQTADPRNLGRELKVRYALEGSVLRSEGRLRINARLVDTATAGSLWADQFDVDRADRLKALNEIVLRLANALDVEIVRADSRRTSQSDPASLDAEDLAMQCVATIRAHAAAGRDMDTGLCEQALLKDAANARALTTLARHYAGRLSRGQTLDAPADLALASGFAARALGADPAYSAAHCAKASVLEGQHQVRDAVHSAERCRALNPSDAEAYLLLSIEHFFLAEPDRTLEYADLGIQLSPRDPRMATFLLFKGWAWLQKGRVDEALVWLRKAQAAQPASPNIMLALTVALSVAGQDEQARQAMRTYLALPRTRARTIAQFDHRPDNNARFAKFAELTNEALLKSGMPKN
jgi:TolB-like protein/DNA-binding winged helix-turn-helix (wHTH) protein/Tfp pilus assembly protein PilF